jgi:hypothetical protein
LSDTLGGRETAKAMISAMSSGLIEVAWYISSTAALVSPCVMWSVSSVATAPGSPTGHRGEVDQVATTVGDELIEEYLGGRDGAQQVGLDHPPVVVGELSGERAEQHYAGVVDKDVGAAEVVLDALRGGDDRVAVGDVRLDRDGSVAELVGQRLDAIQAPGQQRDAMAVGRQSAGGGLADTRRRAGDDRDAAGVVLSAHAFTVPPIGET